VLPVPEPEVVPAGGAPDPVLVDVVEDGVLMAAGVTVTGVSVRVGRLNTMRVGVKR